MRTSTLLSCTLALVAAAWTPAAMATTPAEMLAAYTAEAKQPASAERGQKLFTTNFGKAMGWSCSSCHGEKPTTFGKDELSEKRIPPLAPATNAKRFTDKSLVETKFKLNCKDVVGRECTAAEKADVLAWLISLKP